MGKPFYSYEHLRQLRPNAQASQGLWATGNATNFRITVKDDFQLIPKEAYECEYKLYLSIAPGQVTQAWDLIAPILVREGIRAEVVNPDHMKRLDEKSNIHRGKAITIFADYATRQTPHKRDWIGVLQEILYVLKEQHIQPGLVPAHGTEAAVPQMKGMLFYEKQKSSIDDPMPSRLVSGSRLNFGAVNSVNIFTGRTIDLNQPPVVDEAQSAKGREARQLFSYSPLTPMEIKRYTRFMKEEPFTARVDVRTWDVNRVYATLEKSGAALPKDFHNMFDIADAVGGKKQMRVRANRGPGYERLCRIIESCFQSPVVSRPGKG